MDLLSSIRKTGSRGGVNFSWDDVQTSSHRENYLGHSLMAPVGRWAKNKDLSWYAKGDDDKTEGGETIEERKARERKEEIRKIKEAEEDALARALGLPVKDRGTGTGANSISVGEMNKVIKDAETGDEGVKELGQQKGFGAFVGKIEDDVREAQDGAASVQKSGERESRRKDIRGDSRDIRHRRHRHRSRSGERRRHRSRSGDRHRHRRRHEEDEGRKDRSRSPRERRDRRYRSRSPERRKPDKERESRRETGQRSSRHDDGDRRGRGRDY